MKVCWYHVFRYNALDALRLVSLEDEYFHCERCNGELVAESDKLAAQEVGDGDDNARRRRREKLKDVLQKMEVFFFKSSYLLAYNCIFICTWSSMWIFWNKKVHSFMSKLSKILVCSQFFFNIIVYTNIDFHYLLGCSGKNIAKLSCQIVHLFHQTKISL